MWWALFACVPMSGPPDGFADAASARPRFGWSDGLVLDVDARRERIRVDGDRRSVWSDGATYTLAVTGRRSGLLIAAADLQLGDRDDAPTLLDALAFGVHPPFVVDRSGHYLALDDERLVLREIRALADTMGSAPLDPRAVVGATRDDWEALIGAWNDVELVLGEVKSQRGRTRVPGLDRAAETLAERSYRGRVPCSEDDREARCVALGHVERVAADSRGDVLAVLDAAMSADFAREGLSGRVVDFSLEYSHELVVEPEALVPRRFVTRRTSGLVIESDGGARSEVVQTDRLERRFTPRG